MDFGSIIKDSKGGLSSRVSNFVDCIILQGFLTLLWCESKQDGSDGKTQMTEMVTMVMTVTITISVAFVLFVRFDVLRTRPAPLKTYHGPL